jgi:hypothetical protein
LTISLPLASANVGTLRNLISAKESLIKKALGITDTRINITDDKIEFPWFDRELTPEETNAYTLFHHPALQALEGAEARKQQAGGDRQREVRLPHLASSDGLHWTGLQGRPGRSCSRTSPEAPPSEMALQRRKQQRMRRRQNEIS